MHWRTHADTDTCMLLKLIKINLKLYFRKIMLNIYQSMHGSGSMVVNKEAMVCEETFPGETKHTMSAHPR